MVVEFSELANHFGSSLKARRAINTYVETGRRPPGSPPEWDWENDIVPQFYVPIWHIAQMLMDFKKERS